MQKRKSQTATEYLIILAVVIVIALIVVGVLGGIPSIGGGSKANAQKLILKNEIVGVDNYYVNETDAKLKIKNNNPDSTLRINNITIDGNTCDANGTISLKVGESRLIDCNGAFIDYSDDKNVPNIKFSYSDMKSNSIYETKGTGVSNSVSGGTAGGSLTADATISYLDISAEKIYFEEDMSSYNIGDKINLEANGTVTEFSITNISEYGYTYSGSYQDLGGFEQEQLNVTKDGTSKIYSRGYSYDPIIIKNGFPSWKQWEGGFMKNVHRSSYSAWELNWNGILGCYYDGTQTDNPTQVLSWSAPSCSGGNPVVTWRYPDRAESTWFIEVSDFSSFN